MSHPGPDLGVLLPAWSAVPFAGILLSIALFPLLAPKVWHHHYPKVSLLWGLALVVPFVGIYGRAAVHEILHMAIADYLPFIILLAALFTIGGGILVRGTLTGTPLSNTAILAIGTLVASLVGTTGAAMILVRPLLRANRDRRAKVHTVVFFIFLVANIGGSLTPLGDPPLFLGFLQGVPFFWTLSLLPEYLFAAAVLLAVYFALDRWHFRREGAPSAAAGRPREPLGIDGKLNLLLLLGVLAAVVASGAVHLGEVNVLGVHQRVENLLRDAVLLALLAVSWIKTPMALREANGYSWEPIREVAILFAAIFATIVPALAILRAGEAGALAPLIRAVRSPQQFYWATGLLSSFLDNAPTYLTFLNTALGRLSPGVEAREAIAQLIERNASFLQAISLGAVYMGANTYIGNAPNFMVKAIAEEAGVEMPSFFGYIGRYAIPFLLPVLALVAWIFL